MSGTINETLARDIIKSKNKRIAELESAYRNLENGTDGVVIRRALRAEATIERMRDEFNRLLDTARQTARHDHGKAEMQVLINAVKYYDDKALEQKS